MNPVFGVRFALLYSAPQTFDHLQTQPGFFFQVVDKKLLIVARLILVSN